jgi:uncharacterized membrane protein
MNGWDHMWNFWGMGWGMWFWFLIIFSLGFLYFSRPFPLAYRYERDDPLELARMRLARGEITPEEFELIRQTLEGSR